MKKDNNHFINVNLLNSPRVNDLFISLFIPKIVDKKSNHLLLVLFLYLQLINIVKTYFVLYIMGCKMGCKTQLVYFIIRLFFFTKFQLKKKNLNNNFEALSWKMNQILSKS